MAILNLVSQVPDCFHYSLWRALPEFIQAGASSETYRAELIHRNPIHHNLDMPSLLHPDSQIRRCPECYMTEADGEIMMMHVPSGQYIGMNAVASFIWKRLAEPTDIVSLTRAVQAEFAEWMKPVAP